MRTMNISIPYSLAADVDLLTRQGEYASRSEVVRTALRLFLTLTTDNAAPELLPFIHQPLNKIESELNTAGYKPEFTQSVINGLKKSSVYQK